MRYGYIKLPLPSPPLTCSPISLAVVPHLLYSTLLYPTVLDAIQVNFSARLVESRTSQPPP